MFCVSILVSVSWFSCKGRGLKEAQMIQWSNVMQSNDQVLKRTNQFSGQAASRAEDLGFHSHLRYGDFSG